MPNEKVKQELLKQMQAGKIVAVVGAGVSIATTDRHECASWEGLLQNGIQRCHDELDVPEGWDDHQRQSLGWDDLDAWLGVAEQLERKLRNAGGKYSKWLRETVGELPLKNGELIEAIYALGLPIVTTNDDGLIEQVTPLEAIIPSEPSAKHVFRGKADEGVVHLHGYWRKPESVVLGIRSYERIGNDKQTQALLAALDAVSTFLFIGCGEGLKDPNWGALLERSREVHGNSEFTHYRLAHEGESDAMKKEHPPGDRIQVLFYGEDHNALAPFLSELSGQLPDAPSPTSPPVAAGLSEETIREAIGRYQTQVKQDWEARWSNVGDEQTD